jgi:amino acid transporter
MLYHRLKRFLVGSPLATARERHERLPIPLALAVFASDALSSTAYATDEILIALAGTAFAAYAGAIQWIALPVALLIILLMAAVVLSYRQVIRAYPEGGGSYQVAREQLGATACQLAGAALLIDYVLTVAVSISAGVDALVAAHLVEPGMRIQLAMGFVTLMTVINLRGVKESGKILAWPAFMFMAMMALLIGVGIWKLATGDVALPTMLAKSTTQVGDWTQSLGLMALGLALMNGFSHGCAALTGIEAISNGVTAFKEPAPVNANRTMVIMGLVLGAIFIGMTLLAFGFNIGPVENQTIVSQVGQAVFGAGTPLFYGLQIITMVILILAANTSYSGFPRLGNILANDGYLPRQLRTLGDRLVFSNGILFLGVLSALMIWIFNASTHHLMPLYAVGVFLSFTLAQLGMVLHHKRKKESGYRFGLLVNGFGAILTLGVTILLLVEKFTHGAFIIVIALPVLMWFFRSIKNHYESIGRQLALPEKGYCPTPHDHTVLVLVSSLNRGTIPALEYAKSISKTVEAVHVELYTEGTKRLTAQWEDWGCGIPLTVLKSPYRSLVLPLMDYIDEVEQRYDHDIVTIVVPEFVTKKWWHNLLHNQTSLLIKTLLLYRKGKVVTTIRYWLDQ